MTDLADSYPAHIEHLTAAYAGALAGAGYDALVIHSGSAHKQNRFDDQYWPLCPTPAFTHWLPLAEPDAALIIEPHRVPQLIRTVTFDFWESPPEPEGDHFWDQFETTEVSDPAEIGEHLPKGQVAFVGEDSGRAGSWGIPEQHINPTRLIEELHRIRTIKTGYEVLCIEEASRRATRGHQLLIDTFGARSCAELELHLLYLEATGQDDLDTPYKNIVAIDHHAAVLHHVRYDRKPAAGPDHSLLVDAGASCMGYACDITRTTVKGADRGAALFRELIDRVEALQQTVIGEIAPGTEFEALHDRAHQLLAPILIDLGIARGDASDLVSSGVTRAFLPHGLGHSLGVQVHDVGSRQTAPRPDNQYLRTTFEVTFGQVFTIEPGCYFIEGLLDPLRAEPIGTHLNWAVIEDLARFGGVRIEDNIAVTEAGIRNLTRETWP